MTLHQQKHRHNPYAGLLHILNQRYHAEFVRAELLQNELDALKGSRLAKWTERFRKLLRRVIPHPAATTPHIIESSRPYVAQYSFRADATVSIIIPFSDQPDLLRNCLRSLMHSTFKNFEVILIDNGSVESRTKRLLSRLSRRSKIRIAQDSQAFHFSRLCNLGASLATGNHLLFLNNDTEVISRNWLQNMLSMAADPAVGVVGATLLYPNATIQHAGLFPRSDGLWTHLYRGAPVDFPGASGELKTARLVPAVTGACLMVPRELFDEVGGFDERFPVTHNDVDLCTRIRERGRVTVISPDVRLMHYEGLSRGFSIDSPQN